MKFDFEKIEKIAGNIALYTLIVFVLADETKPVAAIFNKYVFYMQKENILSTAPILIFFTANILMILLAIYMIFWRRYCTLKITPWIKMAIIIMCFKLIRYSRPLLNLTFPP